MKKLSEKMLFLVWALFLTTLIAGWPVYKIATGHHLQWSWVNGKFIWVDQEGKP